MAAVTVTDEIIMSDDDDGFDDESYHGNNDQTKANKRNENYDIKKMSV